jgi:hypothetical protein
MIRDETYRSHSWEHGTIAVLLWGIYVVIEKENRTLTSLTVRENIARIYDTDRKQMRKSTTGRDNTLLVQPSSFYFCSRCN